MTSSYATVVDAYLSRGASTLVFDNRSDPSALAPQAWIAWRHDVEPAYEELAKTPIRPTDPWPYRTALNLLCANLRIFAGLAGCDCTTAADEQETLRVTAQTEGVLE